MTSLPSLIVEALSSPQHLQYKSRETGVLEDVKGIPGLLNESVGRVFDFGKFIPVAVF